MSEFHYFDLELNRWRPLKNGELIQEHQFTPDVFLAVGQRIDGSWSVTELVSGFYFCEEDTRDLAVASLAYSTRTLAEVKGAITKALKMRPDPDPHPNAAHINPEVKV